MEKIASFFCVFWFLTALDSVGQNTYSVNPNPVADADFLSLQTAIDSVPPGSTLMVHGGNYGGISLNKQLNIIGPGYFLAQNPETQASPFEAIVQGAIISSLAMGSYITGIHFSSTVELSASGVVFHRNRLGTVYLTTVNSVIFRQNFGGNILTSGTVAGPSFNLLFENNVLGFVRQASAGVALSGIFTHNIFTDDISSNLSYTPTNSIYRNNICTKVLTSSSSRHPVYNTNGNTVENNLFVGVTYQNYNGSNGNVENLSFSSIFSTGANLSQDEQYRLSPSSVAIGAGFGGVDCGIFGGPRPYVLSGIPFVPNIHFLDVPFTGTSGSGLDVHIKVNANQQ